MKVESAAALIISDLVPIGAYQGKENIATRDLLANYFGKLGPGVNAALPRAATGLYE